MYIRKTLFLILFMLVPGPSPVSGVRPSWMCSLNAFPIENISLPHDFRNLVEGSTMDAIRVLDGGNIERQTRSEYNESDETEESTAYYLSARHCTCANNFRGITDDFYCPEQTNYCIVYRSTYLYDFSVTCTKYKGWKILFARTAWF